MSILRESAKGQECMIRLPGICNFNPSTTVLCHLNGAGMAIKHDDLHAAFGCSNCHAAVDGRALHNYSADQIRLMFLEAIIRTQIWWLQHGYIHILRPVKPRISSCFLPNEIFKC